MAGAPQALARLLRPRAIAVVGATEKPGYASRLFRNLLQGGYDGDVHPVSRSRDAVFGRPAARSVRDLPWGVDVAMVVVPADDVPQVVLDCGEAGLAAAVVITAGFGEAGEEGRRRRELLREAAARSGVLVVGPNGNGYASVAGRVWATTFSGLRPLAARPALPAALLSQSGGSAFGAVHERAQDHGFSFEVVVSTGNEEMTTSEALAGQLVEFGMRVVAMVCEDFHDGPALLRTARAARERGAHVVVLKTGRSAAGRAAAATHTAALAADDAVVDGVLRQHGIVRVDDVDDLVQCVRFLATSCPPDSGSAVVLSHSGGLAALAADALGTAGFHLPELSEPVSAGLDALLPGPARRANPVDVSMALREPVVADIVSVLLDDRPGVLEVVTAGDTALPERVAAGARRGGDGRTPVCVVWTGGVRTAEGMERLDAAEVPWFSGAQLAARVLARCRDAVVRQAPKLTDVAPPSGVPLAVDEGRGKRLLAAAGIAVPHGVLAASVSELLTQSVEVPAPWVLKVTSPSVLHKSAAGLVVLGLEDQDALRTAADRLAERGEHVAGKGWRFVLERQHDVLAELYLGCTLDPHFGPVMGLGRGGANVEQQADVVWSTCPLDEEDVLRVMDHPRLVGWLRSHGVGRASQARVAAAAAALSGWFLDAPERPHQVEVNPLAVDRDGLVVALDAVVHLEEAGEPA